LAHNIERATFARRLCAGRRAGPSKGLNRIDARPIHGDAEPETLEPMRKPFHPSEVALRAQALVRRRRGPGTEIRVGDLVIAPSTQTATLAGQRLDLPFTEFKLLTHLAMRRGVPQSWQDLLREVWGTADLLGGRDVVKTTIYRLRSRLAEVPGGAVYIRTVRGVGYLMPDIAT
jgi:DNA-binding response OmpR family regulator